MDLPSPTTAKDNGKSSLLHAARAHDCLFSDAI